MTDACLDLRRARKAALANFAIVRTEAAVALSDASMHPASQPASQPALPPLSKGSSLL